jgi:hypothetical protein
LIFLKNPYLNSTAIVQKKSLEILSVKVFQPNEFAHSKVSLGNNFSGINW